MQDELWKSLINTHALLKNKESKHFILNQQHTIVDLK